ncbi:uncharacterized protein [Diadema antillarum]|uniref:uncharacterized protein n=1 Tax=Diadema antillarum TaxID=105358 RepID=UPI003A8B3098
MASLTMLDIVQVCQRRKWEYQQAVPPLGGKYWGEKLTEYGGIGGHPFLGRRRVRDLFVSRSHRHFGSGVAKPMMYDQPYRLTDLAKSGCRINDERLSAPMKTPFEGFPRQRDRWPGNHPYYSHKSMFEVFPDGKPKPDAKENATDGRASFQSTSTNSSYDDALRRLHDKLYHTSLYQDSYRGRARDSKNTDYQHPSAASKWERLDSVPLTWQRDVEPARLEARGGLLGGNPACLESNLIREENTDDCDKEQNDCDKEQNGCEEEEEGEETGEGEDAGDDTKETLMKSDSAGQRGILVGDSQGLPKSSKSGSVGTKRSVSFNDTPEILESRENTRDSGYTIPGTGPCWPPSTSLVIENIRGSQLLERRDIAVPLAASGPNSIGRKLLSSSKIGEHIRTLPHPSALRSPRLPSVPLPSSLVMESGALKSASANDVSEQVDETGDIPECVERLSQPFNTSMLYSRQQHQPFTIPLSYRTQAVKPSAALPGIRSSSHPVRKLQDELAKRIMIRKGAGSTPLVLPPAPLSDCLTPSGSKTPHRLGLRFKTEAHKRYHAMYPEQTPDLRSSNHSGRKCFFDGDHSSVFRG